VPLADILLVANEANRRVISTINPQLSRKRVTFTSVLLDLIFLPS
jgi:hypothetical protein